MKTITMMYLRAHLREILDATEHRGESFTVTRNGRPAGTVGPVVRPSWAWLEVTDPDGGIERVLAASVNHPIRREDGTFGDCEIPIDGTCPHGFRVRRIPVETGRVSVPPLVARVCRFNSAFRCDASPEELANPLTCECTLTCGHSSPIREEA